MNGECDIVNYMYLACLPFSWHTTSKTFGTKKGRRVFMYANELSDSWMPQGASELGLVTRKTKTGLEVGIFTHMLPKSRKGKGWGLS
jgi:hypothetical protein